MTAVNYGPNFDLKSNNDNNHIVPGPPSVEPWYYWCGTPSGVHCSMNEHMNRVEPMKLEYQITLVSWKDFRPIIIRNTELQSCNKIGEQQE
ncbi:hypothetical protein M8J77_003472 [Diaphorina citri]|nr:hypothetical protein M8J77_003472 [Diaphorina citri]